MKKKNLFWLIGGVLVLAGVFTGILLWQHSKAKVEMITEAEAKEIIAEKYPGTVVDMNHTNDNYIFTLEREQGTYEVVLNADSGEIQSVVRTSVKEQQKDEVEKEGLLSKEDIKNKLAEQVSGTIVSIEKKKDGSETFYKATVEDDKKETVIIVNARTGKIKESLSEEKDEPVKRLSEEQAIQIALKEVSGDIDDVELKIVDGVYYYFVEVEVEEDDDREALVQIHAITGEVNSLTWED